MEKFVTVPEILLYELIAIRNFYHNSNIIFIIPIFYGGLTLEKGRNMASVMIDEKKSPKPFYYSLYFQVIVAITSGVLVGHFFPEFGASLKPLGDAFISLVKMIIAPVIFLTVVHGIGAVGEDRDKLVTVGGKTMVYLLLLSTLALVIGLIAANLIQPGAGMNIDVNSLNGGDVSNYAKKANAQGGVADFLLHIIPHSFVSAFADGEIIQVLFLAVLTGLALTKVGERAKPVLDAVDSLMTVVFKLVNMLMVFAPIGAFGAMAFTVGEYGVEALGGLAKLVATFYATSFLFIVLVIGGLARFHKIPFLKFLSYIKEEILLVLGTSSSESALPLLMEKLKKAGCGEATVGLVLPLGYSFNLCGINIYMTLGAIFIAQALNIELTLWQELAILGVAMINSKGAAGVTGAGLIVLVGTLSAEGTIPVAGAALILGIDRFMSECRAITSFIANAFTAVIIAKSCNELDYDKFIETISNKETALEWSEEHTENTKEPSQKVEFVS